MNDKLSKARELLLKGDLDASDYRTIKADFERKVSIIEGKLVEISSKKNQGISPLLNKALKNMSRLFELYQSADYEHKRRIISSMYPEKLTFDGVQHRTNRINEAIRVFDSVKAFLRQKIRANRLKKVICPLR